jgi:hypothetical protein
MEPTKERDAIVPAPDNALCALSGVCSPANQATHRPHAGHMTAATDRSRRETFHAALSRQDRVFFDQIVEAAMTDDGLRQAAAVNPVDKFELVFRTLLESLFVERMDQNEEIFVRFMNDGDFRKAATEWMASEAYRQFRGDVEQTGPLP